MSKIETATAVIALIAALLAAAAVDAAFSPTTHQPTAVFALGVRG